MSSPRAASPDAPESLDSVPRGVRAAFLLLTSAALAWEISRVLPDRGNLILFGVAALFAIYPGRSAWVFPIFGIVGLAGELRERAPDPGSIAVLGALLLAGLVEAWWRQRGRAGAGSIRDPLSIAERRRSGTLGPDLAAAAGMTAVGIALLLGVRSAGGSSMDVGLGVLSWALGVGVLKAPLHRLVVERAVKSGASPGRAGLLNGIVSATGELGSAALFFAFLPPQTRAGLLAFGAGPAVVEALMLSAGAVAGWNPLKGTVLDEVAMALERVIDALPRLARALLPVLERLLTVPIHVFTRVLLRAAVVAGAPLAGAAAFLLFAAADGVATTVLLRKAPDRRTVASLYAFLAVVAALASLLGVLYLPPG